MSESEFDRLGEREFERLCQALLLRMHGVTIEIWSGSGDGGADAFSRGPLTFPNIGRRQRGPFVFQIKFVEAAAQLGSRAVTRLRKSLTKERAAIERRIAAGAWTTPRHYVLMTNVRVPPSARARVIDALSPSLAGAELHLVDRRQLDTMLIQAGNGLRRSFPTMLSFRDLIAVVDGVVSKPLLNRSQAFLNIARDLGPVFVTTKAYGKALAMLETHGFVVLTGAPEMGKTSIAKMLAVVQAAAGWDVIDCRSPEDFGQAFDEDRQQLFVADDVFGSTEYQPQSAHAWAMSLPQVIPQLDASHWFVWTSRPAPLREGLERLHLQGSAEQFPAPANVTVDASELTPIERAEMLFTHCRHATLGESARDFVVRHGPRIAAHPRFTPQRAARFASQAKELASPATDDAEAIIDAAMSEVTPAMRTAFGTMDDEQHGLLMSMLDTDPEITVEAVEAAYDRHRRSDASDRRSVPALLRSLEEQVLRRMDPEDRYAWAHPSWRDLVIVRLMDDSARRRRFLSNCGIVGLELAASTAGGTGDRERPLLRTPADWATFAVRVAEQATTKRVDDHRRLLLLISMLLEDQANLDEQLTKLAARLLDQVRETWDDEGSVIPPDVLELYYEVSASVTPLRPGPRLDPTYEAHSLRMAARFSLAAIAEYDDALAFIQIVGRNEPRALRAWRHPHKWEPGIRCLIAGAQKRAEVGERLLTRQTRTAGWERRARELSAELLRWRQMIARLQPKAHEPPNPTVAALERLRRMEHELESWLAEWRSARSVSQVYDEYLMRGAWRDERQSNEPNGDRIATIFSRLSHETA